MTEPSTANSPLPSGRRTITLLPPESAKKAIGQSYTLPLPESNTVRFIIPGSRRAKAGIPPVTHMDLTKTPNMFMDPSVLEDYYREFQERKKETDSRPEGST